MRSCRLFKDGARVPNEARCKVGLEGFHTGRRHSPAFRSNAAKRRLGLTRDVPDLQSIAMARLPPWIRLNMHTDGDFAEVHNLLGDLSLNTVCQDAKCPNIHECWGRGTATFMILGNTCTRACTFCAIASGKPASLDLDEPRRVVEAAQKMNLTHAVVTSVARDDLPDGGSVLFAETISALREGLPTMTLEVLIPDFNGDEDALGRVLDAGPDVLNHNLETVRRFQSVIRPQAAYGRSLAVLKAAAARRPSIIPKSGIMLGLGETDDEILEAMKDLRSVGCELLTLGQYLQPSRTHATVERYVSPEEFDRLAGVAEDLGFKGVASGPMVRSSYRADELLLAARTALLSSCDS